MTIDNEVWLSELRSEDEGVRDEAILRLRSLLMRGLGQSLSNRYGQSFSTEDVVQEALMKILGALDQFEGRSRFLTWAMTVATRIGISSLRRKFHQDVSMELFRGDDNSCNIEVAVGNGSEISEALERHELLAILQDMIDSDLTDKQRLVVRAFLSGSSADGIAERIGENRNAVYKLIHDARGKLRRGFDSAGVSAADVYTAFA